VQHGKLLLIRTVSHTHKTLKQLHIIVMQVTIEIYVIRLVKVERGCTWHPWMKSQL